MNRQGCHAPIRTVGPQRIERHACERLNGMQQGQEDESENNQSRNHFGAPTLVRFGVTLSGNRIEDAFHRRHSHVNRVLIRGGWAETKGH
jgi:hypothetical protein